MAWLWLLLAFALFMALLRSIYAVNRSALRRFGYAPFSLPNAALMLVVNLLLLSALAPAEVTTDAAAAGVGQAVKLGAAGLLAAGLLVIVARRTSLWYALYAVALLSIGAIAVLPSLVFMRVAGAGHDAHGEQAKDPPERDD